jgi:hypothetical protein
MKKIYNIALFCALFPLLIGTLDFCLWLITKSPLFEMLGMFIILGGLVLFILGFIFVFIYLIIAKKTYGKLQKTNLIKAGLIIILLLINFPVSSLYVREATKTISLIHVVNNSHYDIENLKIIERGKEYYIGTLKSGENLDKEIEFRSEGSVEYILNINNEERKGVITGYITTGIAIDADLIIDKDTNISVKEQIINRTD